MEFNSKQNLEADKVNMTSMKIKIDSLFPNALEKKGTI